MLEKIKIYASKKKRMQVKEVEQVSFLLSNRSKLMVIVYKIAKCTDDRIYCHPKNYRSKFGPEFRREELEIYNILSKSREYFDQNLHIHYIRKEEKRKRLEGDFILSILARI